MAHLSRTSDTERGSNDRASRPDDGVIVVSWLIKLLIALAVIGVIGYDAIGIATTQLAVREDAQAAAQQAHDIYFNSKDPKRAYAAVVAYSQAHGDILARDGFSLGRDGTVSVTFSKQAQTMMASRIGPLKHYVTSSATATARDALA